MMRRHRVLLTMLVLATGLSLAGCEGLEDFFSNKKPLPGERKAVFPEGVPGVPHGVPAELVKGYQPPAEPPPVVEEPEPPKPKVVKPKPKPKPKPRQVARPGGVTIQPAAPMSGAPQAQPSPFPPPPPPQSGAQPQPAPSPWPDPPKSGTFSR